MRFTMARGELLEALSTASRGMSSRSTLPILSGILVSCEANGSVVFQTTDLEVSLRCVSSGLVEREGITVLPGRLFTDIVKSLPEAAVSISVEGEMASIVCAQSSFKMKALPAEDFPRFPEVDADKTLSIDSAVFADLVSHVARAVSRDETRPVLTGVLLVIEGPLVKMVATDSYRLAMKEVVLEEPAGEDCDVVVPAKALEEAVKLSSNEKTVELGITDNQIIMTFENTTFVTRRIEGSFPNYKQLIPREFSTSAVVTREELSSAVKRVSLLAQHNTPLRVAVKPQDQTLKLTATTQDVGDAAEEIMVKTSGEDVEIAFNHGFLADGIAAAAGDTVEIKIVSPLKPGVLESEGDEGFLYLLMPVRLG